MDPEERLFHLLKQNVSGSRNKINKSIESGSTEKSEVTLETGVEYSIKWELQNEDEKTEYNVSYKLQGPRLSCLDHQILIKTS